MSPRYPYSPTGRLPGGIATKLPDPLLWMAHVGAMTKTLRFITGVIILPQRNPLVLAKQVATLDFMTKGRISLGIGVGWLREEFEALGVPFAARGKRTDEYIEAMRALWSSDDVSYEGKFVRFAGMSSNPKPVNGAVPILIGGHTEAAARRAGRLPVFPCGSRVTREFGKPIRETKQMTALTQAGVASHTGVDWHAMNCRRLTPLVT